ncbi:Sugar phosphate isomerase/epimerase [Paenibacillus sp. UNCCL117]|uniref:sugar phosphate isomerase/epimerase family protein n=1 Tax=unclassified Paenibacillus TaxID=185978 RepID=UPI0008864B25|nr:MULTISPECIES: sugar phosphate isomerase/epimerase [unclassified Paenibacillus]SDD64867.1 Sugar phosphate isomerase/epimerase [Paenibacillus sp. cl123]SFW58235.1 Sugar phosphate isomerase/epimerase [Paenibacillus sp. UNCCL117]
MKFAAFSGVFIDYSIQETLRMTKQLGLDGLEIAAREPHLSPTTSVQRVKEIRSVADSYGLELPAIAGYMGGFSTGSDSECEKAYEDFCRMLPIAGELGASMVRVGAGGPNAFLAKDYHYAKAAYWLNRCAEEAAKHHVRVILEIHNVSLVETVQDSLRLAALVNQPNLGFIHDAGNMYITDTDYGRESVLTLGKHLFHVHVKDEKRVEAAGAPGTFANLTKHGQEFFLQSRMGEGGADHRPLFDALRETGYDGWVTLECHAPFPPYERLEHDFRFVKELLVPAQAK